MQQRGERYRRRMAQASQRVAGHLEPVDAGEILLRSAQGRKDGQHRATDFWIGHYGARKWWFTLTVLPQIAGRPHEDGSSLYLEEHEKLETRLKFGYTF